jgi:hypothetical protein
VFELFRIHGVLGEGIFQDPIGGHVGENTCQVLAVNVVEIVVDDVFDGNGESLENIQVLGKGEPLTSRAWASRSSCRSSSTE